MKLGYLGGADITEPLSTDYLQCLNRLKSLHVRLERDPDLLREYHNIIQEQLRAGVIELVPKDEDKKSGTHLMPHHGVVRKYRKRTKLRIVFDGSTKSSEGGLSLNEHLENWPNFIPPYEGEYEGVNPILPGLLNTLQNRILPPPPNSLVFYPRSIKFGM